MEVEVQITFRQVKFPQQSVARLVGCRRLSRCFVFVVVYHQCSLPGLAGKAGLLSAQDCGNFLFLVNTGKNNASFYSSLLLAGS